MKSLIIIITLLFCNVLQAQNLFKGLNPIHVTIGVTGMKDKSFEKELKTLIELPLRKAGIKVVDDPADARLRLKFDILILLKKKEMALYMVTLMP